MGRARIEPLSGTAGNSPLKLPISKAKLIVAVARRIEPSEHIRYKQTETDEIRRGVDPLRYVPSKKRGVVVHYAYFQDVRWQF